jgi:DtxR family Mn-dependent transcriptional regulator
MDSPADRRARGLKPLAEARNHERLAVASVFERDRKLLEYLDRSGIRPGMTVRVVAANEQIDLTANGLPVRVERDIAAKIWVRPKRSRRGLL